MLKAIHVQAKLTTAKENTEAVVKELKAIQLGKTAKLVSEYIQKTPTYSHYPWPHWKESGG